MANFFDRSDIKDNDISVVIVKREFQFSGFGSVIDYALAKIESMNSSKEPEMFAIHESIQLIVCYSLICFDWLANLYFFFSQVYGKSIGRN